MNMVAEILLLTATN